MKTLKEFIQRLQDDARFEERARVFVTDDELMAFVRSEGYDFTLEELAGELQQGAERSASVDPAPPARQEAATRLRPEAKQFTGAPAALPKSESRNFPWEDPPTGSGKPQGQASQAEPQGRSPGELLRLGGGRHRGFSPRRLKSVAGDEP